MSEPTLADIRELRAVIFRLLATNPVYRRPIGAEGSLARDLQQQQIEAEDAAKSVLKHTEIYQ